MLGSSVMMRQRRRFRAVARVSILSDPAQATKCRVTAAVCVDATFTACRPSTTEHGSVRSRGRALAVDGLEQRAMDLVDRAIDGAVEAAVPVMSRVQPALGVLFFSADRARRTANALIEGLGTGSGR